MIPSHQNIETKQSILQAEEVIFQIFPHDSSLLDIPQNIEHEHSILLEKIFLLEEKLRNCRFHMEKHSLCIQDFQSNQDVSEHELIKTIIDFEAQMFTFETIEQSLLDLVQMKVGLEKNLMSMNKRCQNCLS